MHNISRNTACCLKYNQLWMQHCIKCTPLPLPKYNDIKVLSEKLKVFNKNSLFFSIKMLTW